MDRGNIEADLVITSSGKLVLGSKTKGASGKRAYVMNMSTLVARTWQVWRQKVVLSVLLMGLVIAVLFVVAMIVNYVVAPHPPEVMLKEVWQGMNFLQKLVVVVLFNLILAVQYRALAASAFVTQEVWNGRSVHFWEAIRSVSRKQLRLFWMVLLASVFTGPLGLIVGPILIFATAAGFPSAILEGKTGFAAVKRGNALLKHDRGKIAVLVILWLGIGIAAVIAWVRFLMLLGDQFGEPFPWYLRPVPAMGFWLILLLPQLYLIALTLLFLERRKLEIESATAGTAEIT